MFGLLWFQMVDESNANDFAALLVMQLHYYFSILTKKKHFFLNVCDVNCDISNCMNTRGLQPYFRWDPKSKYCETQAFEWQWLFYVNISNWSEPISLICSLLSLTEMLFILIIKTFCFLCHFSFYRHFYCQHYLFAA